LTIGAGTDTLEDDPDDDAAAGAVVGSETRARRVGRPAASVVAVAGDCCRPAVAGPDGAGPGSDSCVAI
jgi:hypothetical protein